MYNKGIMNDFDEYKRIGEPEKYEKAENWQIAIGLQQVDGLTPSEYLVALAKKNIAGELTMDEVKGLRESSVVTRAFVVEE